MSPPQITSPWSSGAARVSFTLENHIVASTRSSLATPTLRARVRVAKLNDLSFWSALNGRALAEPEFVEIRANLIGFVRALLAPGLRKRPAGRMVQ